MLNISSEKRSPKSSTPLRRNRLSLRSPHTSNAPSNSKIPAIKPNVTCFRPLASRLVTTALLKSGAVLPFRAHDKSIDNSGLCAHPRSPACFRVSRHAAALSQHRSQITRILSDRSGVLCPDWRKSEQQGGRVGPRAGSYLVNLAGGNCQRRRGKRVRSAVAAIFAVKQTNRKACIHEAIVAPGKDVGTRKR